MDMSRPIVAASGALLLTTAVHLMLAQAADAQERDSIVYICMANNTGNRVYVSGDDKAGKSFEGEVNAGGVYLIKYRRDRDIDRNLKIWVNGREHQAKYKWTWVSPEELTTDKACFFNKWNIKQGQSGLAYLEYASQQTDG
jgi:hypothetical protein